MSEDNTREAVSAGRLRAHLAVHLSHVHLFHVHLFHVHFELEPHLFHVHFELESAILILAAMPGPLLARRITPELPRTASSLRYAVALPYTPPTASLTSPAATAPCSLPQLCDQCTPHASPDRGTGRILKYGDLPHSDTYAE